MKVMNVKKKEKRLIWIRNVAAHSGYSRTLLPLMDEVIPAVGR